MLEPRTGDLLVNHALYFSRFSSLASLDLLFFLSAALPSGPSLEPCRSTYVLSLSLYSALGFKVVMDYSSTSGYRAKGTQGDREAEDFQVSNDDAAVAQRQLEKKQLEDKHRLLEGNVAGRKKRRSKEAKLGNLLKYNAWLTRRSPDMLEGVRRFNEQDVEVKKRFYTRDMSRIVVYNTNFDLRKLERHLLSVMPPSPLPLEELPEVCRDTQIEYSDQVMKLAGSLLFPLFSEALGLKPNHLGDIDCDKGLRFAAHYAPACPQPDPTMGIPKHTDAGFLIVVLQNDIGGLQMLHQDQWVYVPPTPDTLVIN
ncbi:1-aminocyclopropane-1-carboxylate oxidase homolog 1-like protein, partial [Tanacetum coccineum]